MAIVADAPRGRVFLSPTDEMEAIARKGKPTDIPDTEIPKKALGFRIQEYGMTRWRDLFTNRQLVALSTFADLIPEAQARVRANAESKTPEAKRQVFESGGIEYANAVALYLSLAIDKMSDYGSTLVVWSPTRNQVKTTFSRQALAMVWDFSEVNIFADAAGDFRCRSRAFLVF